MGCVRCVRVAFAMCAIIRAPWRCDSSSGIAIDGFYPTRARARGLFVAVNRSRARACGGDGNGIDSAVDVADAMGD